MSTTFQLDTSTSRANPTPAPMKRLTVPVIRARKAGGITADPLVMLTAYTARQAQLLDAHCDLLLVGDSLGQVIYGLPSTVPVTLEMMANHGAAVVRGSYHSVVVVDMPFGSYEASPQQAFESAAFLLKQTGAAAVKLEGGERSGAQIAAIVEAGIPVMGHVGFTPQSVNALGGFKVQGRGEGAEQLQAAELELRSQGREVLAQHRQHLSAAGAGVGDGGRHGSGGADGGILGAMSWTLRTRVQSSPLKACCRRDCLSSSRAASLRSSAA